MAYYCYDPNAAEFAAIGFPWSEDGLVTSPHASNSPLLPIWKPLACHEFDDDPEQQGDFPSLSNYRRIPVMSDRAWNSLEPLIGYCCEALPIIHPSGTPHFIIHVMETIDALDEERSELRRSRIDGRVNRIFRYCLKDELLHGKHIFKLPLESGGELLVDEEFRRVVEGNGLRGLLFEELPLVDER